MTGIRRRQRGFALLLTLVLLMIAAVALARVARQSAGEAIQVKAQTEDLQRRWAMTSCRATLLPRAQGLLMAGAQGEKLGPGVRVRPGELRLSCELSGLAYDLVLTDEQTKYNPTAMGALRLGEDKLVTELQLRAAVRDLSGMSGEQIATSVRLRPLIGIDAQGNEIAPDKRRATSELPGLYVSYGQLFNQVPPDALVGTYDRPGIASRLTCWGDGRLNLAHTSSDVMKRVLGPVLSGEGVQQLLIARSESPEVDAKKWIEAAVAATPEERMLAQALATERSNAQGLWVIGRGQTRSWYSLSVRVYTPLSDLEAKREAQAEGLSPQEKQALAEKPLPDPIRRYDFTW